MEVRYKPSFVRQYKKLDQALKEEIKEKIDLFRDRNNHKKLKVHKLKGELSELYSFSVNYSIRIVFVYESKETAVLMAVGDHDINS